MRYIIFTDRLDFAGESLPVHLGSDRQIYVQLDELCSFIGIDPKGRFEQIRGDDSTADVLVVMDLPNESATGPGRANAAFLNLAAVSYWLGTICSERMKRPDLHDCLVRYTYDFLDVTWMFYRAALHQLDPADVASR